MYKRQLKHRPLVLIRHRLLLLPFLTVETHRSWHTCLLYTSDAADDSLSAVDAKTEHAIFDNLKHTRKDKTTIITAHRLSAVVHADLILVMQNGRIIERGRHEDLLAQGGWYAKTYESQQLEMEGGEVDA